MGSGPPIIARCRHFAVPAALRASAAINGHADSILNLREPTHTLAHPNPTSRCMPHRLSVLIALLVGSLSVPVHAQPGGDVPSGAAVDALARVIDDTLDAPTYAGATWSVMIAEAESGRVLYTRNGASNLVPASNVKLYTAAAALGPDFQYETRLYRGGPVRDGVLHGPLVVRGSGDPSIGGEASKDDPTSVFRAWADSLRAEGIRQVHGDVVGDDDVFDDEALGKGWSVDDTPYAYAAEIGGLAFYGNKIDLRVIGQRPGQPARIDWKPMRTGYVTIDNRSVTTRGGRVDEDYRRRLGTNTICVGTRVPAGVVEREALTVSNPTKYFVHVLRDVLMQQGLAVDGAPVDVDDAPIKPRYDDGNLQRVASTTSPAMRELVTVVNEESDNLYAEQILRTLAVHAASDTLDLPPGSAELGTRVVLETAARAGVDTARVQFADGSGLSRHNLVSAQATVQLLQYMWTHPDAAVREAFVASLPVGGRSGTIEYRFRGNAPAGGNVQAKTGTLSNVIALAGYVRSTDGTPLAFAIMSNHHTSKSSAIRRAQDVIVNALAGARL